MTTTATDGPALIVRVAAEADGFNAGGTVTYRVYCGDRWIGWVGDGREWRGWRYGARRWWACWRETGDTTARWHSDLTHATRKAALTDLATHMATPPDFEFTRPGAHSAKNARQAGAPNHLQGSGENPMVDNDSATRVPPYQVCATADGGLAVLVELAGTAPDKAATLLRWLDLLTAVDMTAGKFRAGDRVVRLNLRGRLPSGLLAIVVAPFDEQTDRAYATAIEAQIETQRPRDLITHLTSITTGKRVA